MHDAICHCTIQIFEKAESQSPIKAFGFDTSAHWSFTAAGLLMHYPSFRFLITAMLVTVGSLAEVRGANFYDTFGPDNTYNRNAGFTVNAPNIGSSLTHSFQFTPLVSGQFDSLTLPLGISNFGSGPRDIIVQLRTSAANLPGNLLESFEFTELPNNFHGTLVTANSILHPILDQNTNYWLTLLPGSNTTSGLVLRALSQVPGNYATSQDSGQSWVLNQFGGTRTPAFRISGTVIPEPASLSLVVMGIALWSYSRFLPACRAMSDNP